MRTLAYSAASFRRSTAAAAGVEPLLSPPLSTQTLDPQLLEGYDLLYFKLHGIPGDPHGYGDDNIMAIHVDQLRAAHLNAAAVFAANCHVPQGPMLDALLDAGASCVVAGHGSNWANPNYVTGADLLGLWFRRWLSIGLRPKLSFHLAKARLYLTLHKTDAILDAIHFELFT